MATLLRRLHAIYGHLLCRASPSDEATPVDKSTPPPGSSTPPPLAKPAPTAAPAYLAPRSTPVDLQAAQQAILARHITQLKQPKLVAAAGTVASSASTLSSEENKLAHPQITGIGIGVDSNAELAAEIAQWTSASADQLTAAKEVYAAGASPAQIDWNVTRLAIMQSSTVYLRDFTSVKNAVLQNSEEAPSSLVESQQGIVDIAQTWGLGFTVLCDLVDDHPIEHWFWDGPFCGAFYSLPTSSQGAYIIVAFKGTTPTNLGEWFVDLDFTAAVPVPDPTDGASAGPICWGEEVSKGVAKALFEGYEVEGGGGVRVPFDLIVMGVQDLAVALGGSVERPVPFYVTGHSLGASYATLFYAELLRRFTKPSSPSTTPPSQAQPFQPIDLHTFGSPRLALSPFGLLLRSAALAQQLHTWRIVDKNDIVPTIPPIIALDQEFEHVDAGWLVSAGAEAVAVESELGRGMPGGWFEGGIEGHRCENYYAGVVSASTMQ